MEQCEWLIAQIEKYEITFVGNIRLHLLDIWNHICGIIKKMEQCEWLIAQRMKYEITFVTNIRVLAEIWSCPFCVSSFGHMHSRSIPILDIIQFHCLSAQFCTHSEKKKNGTEEMWGGVGVINQRQNCLPDLGPMEMGHWHDRFKTPFHLCCHHIR